MDAKKLGDRELEITFTDERSRRYLEGEWLEDLVYDAVQQGNFDHHATNIALGWQDAPEREMNEIDIAVVHHLRFFYISCKTGSDANHKTGSDANQMKQHLFELETLSNMAGGSSTTLSWWHRARKLYLALYAGAWRPLASPMTLLTTAAVML